jgi:hypothetical protein
VQDFISINHGRLFAETQQLAKKLPLSQLYIDHYLKPLQHKIFVNERILNKNLSQSLDNVLSLVKAVVEYHFDTQSSFKMQEPLFPEYNSNAKNAAERREYSPTGFTKPDFNRTIMIQTPTKCTPTKTSLPKKDLTRQQSVGTLTPSARKTPT